MPRTKDGGYVLDDRTAAKGYNPLKDTPKPKPPKRKKNRGFDLIEPTAGKDYDPRTDPVSVPPKPKKNPITKPSTKKSK